MTYKDRLARWAMTFFVMAASLLSSGSWALGDESSNSTGLVLDIYADDTGKALVTGYAKNIGGLPFLNASEYQYDEDAHQLYAVTNALTIKNGDDWEIRLPAEGVYAEYHVTFYLTENVQLSNITGTEGLDYLVSSSTDSFVVEFHGYDVTSPSAAVRYRQPVGGEGVDSQAASLQTLQPEESSTLPIVLVGGFIIAVVVVSAFKLRRPEKTASPPREEASIVSGAVEVVSELREGNDEAVREDESGSSDASPPVPAAVLPVGDETGEASVSGEMAAVMETLTERERESPKSLVGRLESVTPGQP